MLISRFASLKSRSKLTVPDLKSIVSSIRIIQIKLSLISVLLFCNISFPSQAIRAETIILNVILNQEVKGEFFVDYTDDGDILVRIDDLKAMGFREPTGHIVEISGEIYMSLRSMKDVDFKFNEKTLSLQITVSPALLPKKVIDFAPGRQPKVYYPKDTSAFFNYRLDYYAGDSFDFQSFNLTNEFGLRAGNILFFSDAFYTNTQDDNKVVRLMTNITYDNRAGLERLVAGDFVASSGDLGGTITMGGLSFSKVYRLDPYLIKNPTLNVSGFVTLPSEVEIYLNGMRLRSERLSPGGFDLRDINYYGGAGLLEVIIKDPFGKEERLIFPFYFTDILLRKGLHEYSYNLGAVREKFGKESNRYGNIAFTFFHRYGISDALTIGFRAEALGDMFNYGPQASYSVRDRGIISLSLSKSRSEGRDGAAGTIGYTYQARRFNARFFTSGFTEDYARISGDPSPEKIKFEAGAGIGYATARLGSFSVDFSSLKRFHGVDRQAFTASYSKSLTRKSTFFATFRNTNEEKSSNEMFVGINYFPGRNNTLSASYRRTDDTNQEVVQIMKNTPVGEGVSYRASVERTDTGDGDFTSMNPFVQYNAKHGILAVESKIDFDRQGRIHEAYRLSASGSIAYVGGTIGLSRPVTDSFGIVKVGELEGVKVLYNNEEIGRTNNSGKVFIPNLSAYYENRISINDKDIPMDYTISEVVKFISPPLRSGSFIQFDIAKFQAITGVLNIRLRGELLPAELSEVSMLVDGQEITFSTGKGGEFYFENIKPGSYKALLNYMGKICIFDMIIPESAEIIVDLKEVICESDR